MTFQEFRYDEFNDSIFTIPNDYKEDPSRFPDLWAASAPPPSPPVTPESDTWRKYLTSYEHKGMVLSVNPKLHYMMKRRIELRKHGAQDGAVR